ncbi:MAG: SDR family NAD(P)-dependent oxidoreductase, partial [Chitinophagaceae bacterium]
MNADVQSPVADGEGAHVVLILGAYSDVAREAIKLYVAEGKTVIAASRSVDKLNEFVKQQSFALNKVLVRYFDATAFEEHKSFYFNLPLKPHTVVYAAGFLKNNEEAMLNWEGAYQMMKVHYCGAVSILNIIVTDHENQSLKRVVGLSSLSGVRGRKSNFIYGSTKAAFTQYLAGLRQYLAPRGITVNILVAGYIRTKMTHGLDLSQSLMLEPAFIARYVVQPGKQF